MMAYIEYRNQEKVLADAPKCTDRKPDGITNLIDQLGYSIEMLEKKIYSLEEHMKPILITPCDSRPCEANKAGVGLAYTHEHLILMHRRINDTTDMIQSIIDRFNP